MLTPPEHSSREEGEITSHGMLPCMESLACRTGEHTVTCDAISRFVSCILTISTGGGLVVSVSQMMRSRFTGINNLASVRKLAVDGAETHTQAS